MKDAKKLARRVRKARNEETDTFPEGTVVRWEVETHTGRFLTYVALKAGEVWYTTSTGKNRFVPQILCYEKLVKQISGRAVVSVEVAETWSEVYRASQGTDPENVPESYLEWSQTFGSKSYGTLDPGN